MPITAEDIWDAMSSCTRERSLGFDGRPFVLYLHMPDLFSDLLADIYHNWQQNGRIFSAVSRGVVVLLRKDPNNGDRLDHVCPITLLNADYKILTKVSAKRLTLIVEIANEELYNHRNDKRLFMLLLRYLPY
ncbi:uncharacterized protein LOC106880069 [Octopus bimaculoides]|uniref:uncharacterized protein LOC106880069 n=1 Tax=Octopus bimaculoides TaxID=37653 RepID=UPI00071DAAF7|nr:uncharacterized protein LOC106880069 [Octopus bimaculoides]|eukprot:XP_014785363.1 PREDICTED: uncharacterized protein LOC106880069 [Octopus bimaculoides]